MNNLIKINNSNKIINLSFLDEILGSNTIYKEIDGGARCLTFRVNKNNNKKTSLIIQVYEQQMRYQAYKKFSISKLVSSCTNIPVPHVFDVGETAEHSYVIMQEMPGVRLSLVKEELDFTILDIIPSMSQILSEIHSKINIGKYYGWIEKEVVINPSNNLVNYLDSEIERFDKSLNGIMDK